jgi:hypothetical protein
MAGSVILLVGGVAAIMLGQRWFPTLTIPTTEYAEAHPWITQGVRILLGTTLSLIAQLAMIAPTIRLETLKVNRDLYVLLGGPPIDRFRRYPPPNLRDYYTRPTIKAPLVIDLMKKLRENDIASSPNNQPRRPLASYLDLILDRIQEHWRKHDPART